MPHTLLMRARYGVYFVSRNADLGNAFVTAAESETSCHTEPRYNSAQLYMYMA